MLADLSPETTRLFDMVFAGMIVYVVLWILGIVLVVCGDKETRRIGKAIIVILLIATLIFSAFLVLVSSWNNHGRIR